MHVRLVWCLVLLGLAALPAARAEERLGEEDFDPAKWETNEVPPGVRDPRAVRGGRLRLGTVGWPPTLRTEGPNSRLALLSALHTMVYETLLGYDPVDMVFVPGLASHWQIGEDRKTFRFRLDPRARWPDGSPVTSDDVVASMEHLLDPERKDPLVQEYWEGQIRSVEALSTSIVEVRTRNAGWRSLISIGCGMFVYPGSVICMDGETYLTKWNWKLPPGTGPYEIRPEDVEPDSSIRLRRRSDWWGKELPDNAGFANFDVIEWRFHDSMPELYQAFLRSEVDMYDVHAVDDWHEYLPREEAVLQGWIQMRRIYHRVPQGYGGLCFNMRRPPFDERNVRKAFAHLFPRDWYLEERLRGEYEPTNSYFPGQPGERPGAKGVPFDPERARALLADAGWTWHAAEHRFRNDAGEPFPDVTLPTVSKGPRSAILELVLRGECGIRLVVEEVPYPDYLKRAWARDYQLLWWTWTASHFPEPAQQFHSRDATVPQTNNLNGFASADADRIMGAYELEFDPGKRREMLQRLDELLFDAHLYALSWHAPFWRLAYWDRFGHPPEYVARSVRDWVNVMCYWWFDAKRAARTSVHRRNGRPIYPHRPSHQEENPVRSWWRSHERPMPDSD